MGFQTMKDKIELIRTTWPKRAEKTPAGGTSHVAPNGTECATDYGHKIRVFSQRDPYYAGSNITPFQFHHEETLHS